MQQPSYYAILTANVRYDKNLKANEKLLYAEITALCNMYGTCWATNQYFAKLYDVSTRSVSSWIANLVQQGYINSEIKYKEGSNEVEGRYITLIMNQALPIENKEQNPHEENLNTPLEENFQENTKEEYNINNIYKGDENSKQDPVNDEQQKGLFSEKETKQTPKEFYKHQLAISKGLKHHNSYDKFVKFLYGDNEIGEILTPILRIPKQITYNKFCKFLEEAHRNNKKPSEILLKIYNNKKYTDGKRDLYLLLHNWATNRFINDKNENK